MGRKQPRSQHLHDGEQHTETKTHRQWTSVHTHSSSRHPKKLFTNISTQQIGTQ